MSDECAKRVTLNMGKELRFRAAQVVGSDLMSACDVDSDTKEITLAGHTAQVMSPAS
jgi:hypothetical protein